MVRCRTPGSLANPVDCMGYIHTLSDVCAQQHAGAYGVNGRQQSLSDTRFYLCRQCGLYWEVGWLVVPLILVIAVGGAAVVEFGEPRLFSRGGLRKPGRLIVLIPILAMLDASPDHWSLAMGVRRQTSSDWQW